MGGRREADDNGLTGAIAERARELATRPQHAGRGLTLARQRREEKM